MLNTIESINNVINNFIWGVPAMICIIGVGLYLSFGLRFLQIRKFPYAIRVTIGRIFRKRDASDGAMTPGSLHSSGCYRWNRKHCRCRRRDRHWRPGCRLLDVGFRGSWHVHQIR